MMFQDKCFRSNSDAARFANDLFRRLATCFANPYCMLPREDRFPVTHHGYPPIKLDVQHGQFPLANLGIDVNETPPRDRRRNERTIGVWMETSREGLIAGRNQMFFGFGREDFSWIFSEAAHCDSRSDSRRSLAVHTQDPPQPYTLRRYRFSMFATVIVLLEES